MPHFSIWMDVVLCCDFTNIFKFHSTGTLETMRLCHWSNLQNMDTWFNSTKNWRYNHCTIKLCFRSRQQIPKYPQSDAPKSSLFLTLWRWSLTHDLDKLMILGHYHHRCVSHIWENSVLCLLSYSVHTICTPGGGGPWVALTWNYYIPRLFGYVGYN